MTIKHAAIRKDGKVWTGPNHASIIHDIAASGGRTPVTGEQGFVTHNGSFVDRAEAGKIAIDSGQVKELRNGGNRLYSEDFPRCKCEMYITCQTCKACSHCCYLKGH